MPSSQDFDYESLLESAEPAPLGRSPETRDASSHEPQRRSPSLTSDDSSYSPPKDRTALPRPGRTFSPPAPPPSFAPPPPNPGAGFASVRSSVDTNLNHIVKRKPLSSSASALAARHSGPSSNVHNPDAQPSTTSARHESYISGSSRYSEYSPVDERYVCFFSPFPAKSRYR